MKTKSIILCLFLLLAALPAEAGKVSFGRYFTGGTLRIDCMREGNVGSDTV